MNIKELAEQAGMYCDDDAFFSKRHFNEQDVNIEDLKRFAELVAAAERQASAKRYHEIMHDVVTEAVAKEREACAKVCDEAFVYFDGDTGSLPYAAFYCSKAIRERGEKE